MTQYPTQSHHPDTVLNFHYPIILMLSTRICSNKYKFYEVICLTQLGFEPPTFRTRSLPSTDSVTASSTVSNA